MARSVGFVIVEAAAAAYLTPLWQRWLSEPMHGWWVLAASQARQRIEHTTWSGSFPLLAAQEPDDDALESAIASKTPRRVLVSAAGYGLEAAAIRAARRRGIAVDQFIDNWYGYQRRLHPDAMPDRVFVIDQAAAREAAGEGIDPSFLRVLGHPAWESAQPLPPAPASSATFLSAPVARHYGRHLGYDEHLAWKMAQAAATTWPALISSLVFAAHPAERCATASAGPSGESAILAAGTVLGMFAAPMIPALLGGRRVISVQPGAVGADLCALSRHGRIPRATTLDELGAALAGPQPEDPADLRQALVGSCDRLSRALEEASS